MQRMGIEALYRRPRTTKLLVGLVVIAPNGGFLEGAVHPLDLTVGPGMVRFGEAVLPSPGERLVHQGDRA